MSFERKVYMGSITLSGAGVLAGVYTLYRMWRISAPLWLLVGLVLAVVAVSLTGYMGYRALNGIRPTANDRISVALKLLSVAIFLTLFGPRLWAALHVL
ncbi:MAG TPA: hypothetical protein VF613_20475 [Longimicrobium sp.]|jgi:hypothetical protein